MRVSLNTVDCVCLMAFPNQVLPDMRAGSNVSDIIFVEEFDLWQSGTMEQAFFSPDPEETSETKCKANTSPATPLLPTGRLLPPSVLRWTRFSPPGLVSTCSFPEAHNHPNLG